MSEPLRFGVCLPNFPFGVEPSREALLQVAQAAERLGYASVWVSDHVLVPREVPRYGRIYESLTTLAWLAGTTSSVRLGTSVLIAPLRNPMVLAKQAATIDDLSGGRLTLGVGAGWVEGEYRNLRVDFSARGRLLDEAIGIFRELWSGETRRFDDALFAPVPVQAGGIPIWVGGNSERSLSRAAELGDAWHADGLSSEALQAPVRRLRQLTPPGRRVAVTLRRTIDLRPGAGEEPIGSGEVPMGGSVAEIAAELAALEATGVEDLVLQFEHRSMDEHAEQLELFAAELLGKRPVTR